MYVYVYYILILYREDKIHEYESMLNKISRKTETKMYRNIVTEGV